MLLAVVDARYRFRVVDVGHTGGAVTMALWPLLISAIIATMAHSICLKISLCPGQNILGLYLMSLLLTRPSPCDGT